jgi:hypothetical protein
MRSVIGRESIPLDDVPLLNTLRCADEVLPHTGQVETKRASASPTRRPRALPRQARLLAHA